MTIYYYLDFLRNLVEVDTNFDKRGIQIQGYAGFDIKYLLSYLNSGEHTYRI